MAQIREHSLIRTQMALLDEVVLMLGKRVRLMVRPIDFDKLDEALMNAVVFDYRDNLNHEIGRAGETSRLIKEAARRTRNALNQDSLERAAWALVRYRKVSALSEIGITISDLVIAISAALELDEPDA